MACASRCVLTSALFSAALLTSAASQAAEPPASRIAEVERSLDLAQLMRQHGVPGISVAVIDHFKLVWAKGYGVTEKNGTNPVTPRTLFLAGSISKPVTALGALALVDEGKLDLDRDVNDVLKIWHVAENENTARHKVTLALILDHTAGFTGGDFYAGYAPGQPFPTLPQILDGQKPATNDPVRVSFLPGSKWHYSGDGYLVAQQLMMDATGKPFPALMRELVFDRLDMIDTTFEQPLGADRAGLAAAGTLMNGDAVNGKWHVQPEMAAGGLWTTPSDLAKLAIEVALETAGKSNRILSQRLAREMIAPHWDEDVINILGTPASPDRMGYGFFVGDGHRFGHIGGNVGYQASLVMFADSGNGAVIMTNSDIGLQAGNALLDAIAKAYGWNYTAPPPL
jgi:CubicO group peptidase (beta-lactamase class C family)